MRRLTRQRLFGILLTIVGLIRPHIAAADWREDVGTLRIGIVAGDDISGTIVHAEPFRLAIQEGLNIPVEIFGSRDLPSLVRAHSAGRVEYAILTATAYAATYAICECIEPVVAAKSADGAVSFNSVIISRKDSGLSTPNELFNKRLLALSRDSVAGYAFAMFELKSNGIDLVKNGSRISFENTAQDAIRLFASGQGDALIGWSSLTGDASTGYSRGTLKDLSDLANVPGNQYQVIWKSSEIAHRVHSITKKLPAAAKQILRETLLELFEKDPVAYDAIEPVFGGGFTLVKPGLFEPLIKFVANSNVAPAAAIDAGKSEDNKEDSPPQKQ